MLTPRQIFQPAQNTKQKKLDLDSEYIEEQIYKIVKAIIAQIALGELDKDLNLSLGELDKDLILAFLAIEVLGIKIPLTFREAINDLKYGI